MVDPADKHAKSYSPERRQFPRRRPDSKSLAHLDLRGDDEAFRADLIALVINESAGGCSLVTLITDEDLKLGDSIRIKPGQLHPMKAKVIWRTEIDEEVMRLGLKYS